MSNKWQRILNHWRMIALLLFTNIAIISLVLISLDSSYRQYESRAAIASRNTTRLLAQSVHGSLDQINLAFHSILTEVRRLHKTGQGLDAAHLDEYLTRQQAQLPMTDGLRFVDADGWMVAGSGGVHGRIHVGDRGYFQAVRDRTSSSMVISPPVEGRLTQKWILIFARRAEDDNGRFLGAVLATVTIDWFERLFEQLEVGAGGAVVLRGDASRDFDLLARYPHAGYVGQTKVSDTFRARITARPEGDTYQAHAGADNIHRTFTYRPIPGYPLIVLVGLATEDYLVEWRSEATKLVLLAFALCVVCTAGGIGLLRTWKTLIRRTTELARSNADLEQFAYVASHDLQTPLRNIVSYTQLLEKRYRSQLDEEAREYMQFIVGNGKRMASLISDVLEYSRVSHQTAALIAVDSGQVVQRVLSLLRKDIDQLQATVTMEPLPVVLGDEGRLFSLFQNLVSNALKYHVPGQPPVVYIRARKMPPDLWCFSVEDQGIGIDPVYHDKIFEMFQRLNPRQEVQGTGIGLTLCRRIVERLGGRIWLTSEPGKGTTISFTLRETSLPPTYTSGQ